MGWGQAGHSPCSQGFGRSSSGLRGERVDPGENEMGLFLITVFV